MADEKPPFDMVRATFYLVAAIFGVYAVGALSSEVICTFAIFDNIPNLPLSCTDGKVSEVFGTLLASALAYAAGRSVSK